MKNKPFSLISPYFNFPSVFSPTPAAAVALALSLMPLSLTAAPKNAAKALESVQESPVAKQISALTSKDVNARRQAAEELGRLRSPHAVPALITALSDEDALVRSGAARTLGLMRSGDAAKDIARLLKTDPDAQVRQASAVSLGFLGGEEGVSALITSLKDSIPGVRYASCQALGNLKAVDALPTLTESLKDPSPAFRKVVVNAVGEIGNPSAAPELKALLKDKDPSVQSAALVALGKIKDVESIPTLKKFLGKKNTPEEKLAAAQGLALMNDPSGRTAALDVLKDKAQDARFRVQALQILNTLPDPSLLPALKTVLQDEPEGPVRQALPPLIERLSGGQ